MEKTLPPLIYKSLLKSSATYHEVTQDSEKRNLCRRQAAYFLNETSEQNPRCNNESLKTAFVLLVFLVLFVTYLSCRLEFYSLVVEKYLQFQEWAEKRRWVNEMKKFGDQYTNALEKRELEIGNFVSPSDRSSTNSLHCNHSLASSQQEHFFNCARALLVNHKTRNKKIAEYNLKKIYSASTVTRFPLAVPNETDL